MDPVLRPFRSEIRLVVLAFALRGAAAWAVALSAGPDLSFPDTDHYLAMARRVLEGEGMSIQPWALAHRPPLYPLFLALHLLLFGHEGPALATQAALGAATCLAVARLGTRLWGPRAGAFAGWIAAVYPFLIFSSVRFLSESIAIPLVAAQLLAAEGAGRAAFAREGRRAAARALLTGALGGLAALARPELLLLTPLLAALFAVVWCRARQLAAPDGPRILVAGVGLAAVAASAVVAPWTLRNACRLGAFVPVTTQCGTALYEASFPGATGGIVDWRSHPAGREAHLRTLSMGEVESDRFLRAEAWRSIRRDPLRFAGLAAVKLARLWSPIPNYPGFRSAGLVALSVLTYGPVLILAALGALRLRRGSILALLLLAAPLALSMIHLVFIGSIRYRLPAEPALILLASYRLAGSDNL
jgi:4-amino-4-deoxy-L-arabinose transferase-like glycosyltransferase